MRMCDTWTATGYGPLTTCGNRDSGVRERKNPQGAMWAPPAGNPIIIDAIWQRKPNSRRDVHDPNRLSLFDVRIDDQRLGCT